MSYLLFFETDLPVLWKAQSDCFWQMTRVFGMHRKVHKSRISLNLKEDVFFFACSLQIKYSRQINEWFCNQLSFIDQNWFRMCVLQLVFKALYLTSIFFFWEILFNKYLCYCKHLKNLQSHKFPIKIWYYVAWIETIVYSHSCKKNNSIHICIFKDKRKSLNKHIEQINTLYLKK